jgi:nucleoside permease NupC
MSFNLVFFLSEANNVFEAISQGASNMVGPIGGIISNLIAFTAIFALIDSIFMWFFAMLNLEDFGLSVKNAFRNLIGKYNIITTISIIL